MSHEKALADGGQITSQTSRIVREQIILNTMAMQETMLAGQEEDGSSKK
ncbi:hypothetical protein NKH86_29535 [Mesorhizobium sp. M0913]